MQIQDLNNSSKTFLPKYKMEKSHTRYTYWACPTHLVFHSIPGERDAYLHGYINNEHKKAKQLNAFC